MVKTSNGQGKVIDSQILTQLVMVEFENGDKEAFKLDEIEILRGSFAKPQNIEKANKNKPKDNKQNNNNYSNKNNNNNKSNNEDNNSIEQ